MTYGITDFFKPVLARLGGPGRPPLSALICLLSAVLLGACVQNPVTGKKDFLLVSEDWELQIGAQQYLPLRQAQGGDYVVDPEVEAYVRSVGQRLAAQSDRQLPYEFHVINDSSANAWALPGGKISINRGLLVQLKNESELAAVLGHEIVHAAAKHGAKGQTRGIGLQLGVLTATVLGGREGYGQQAQLLSSVGAQLITSQYGQGAELEADHFGMTYMNRAGYDPQGAVELQRTFVRLSEGRSSDIFSRLFATHPPSEKRVAQNIATARTLPPGGDLKAREYQQAIASLTRSRKAYEAFDQAQLAFKEQDVNKATSLLSSALKIEPREAHFHSLAGDIALSKNNLSTAKRSFDKAISLNNEFYYYYLQRGKINELQKNARAAQSDYALSVKLLPTSAAQLGLGQFAERAGKTADAKRYYAAAAQVQGEAGEQAQAALVRLDPTLARPVAQGAVKGGKGLSVTHALNRNGVLMVQLFNETANDIAGVRLGIGSGQGTRQQEMLVSEVIPAGEIRMIDSGRRLSKPLAARIQVKILDYNTLR